MRETTFNEKELSKINKARILLERACFESCYDNRDTQMIEETVEIIEKVIKFNTFKGEK